MATSAEPAQNVITEDEVDYILDNNLTEKFHLLRGAQGYCIDTMSYDRAKELIDEGSQESLGTMGRDAQSTIVYRQFRTKVLQEYASIPDLVKVTIQGWPFKLNAEGKKVADTSKPHTFQPVWRLNDFPYNYEDGVEHHNLWAQKPLSDEQIVQEIEKHRSGWDYCYFVNPAPLASIPELWHAHILSRRKLA